MCIQCNQSFPHSIIIDGVRKVTSRRKYCLVCSPWGSFNQSGRGNPKRKPESKEAYALRQNKRRHRIKSKAIEYLGGECSECQYSICKAALEFHHIDPKNKKFPLDSSNLCRVSWDVALSELDKCVLLCCRCHREVEAGIRILKQK